MRNDSSVRIVDLPDGATWNTLCVLFNKSLAIYSFLQRVEALTGKSLPTSEKEVQCGWNDICKVLSRSIHPDEFRGFLNRAGNHFWIALSEAWESLLTEHLNVVETIISSFRGNASYRVERANCFTSVSEAYDRARYALVSVRQYKRVEPNLSIETAKNAYRDLQLSVAKIVEMDREGGEGKDTLKAILHDQKVILHNQYEEKTSSKKRYLVGAGLAIAGLVLTSVLFLLQQRGCGTGQRESNTPFLGAEQVEVDLTEVN